jgi:hypothetical protein
MQWDILIDFVYGFLCSIQRLVLACLYVMHAKGYVCIYPACIMHVTFCIFLWIRVSW